MNATMLLLICSGPLKLPPYVILKNPKTQIMFTTINPFEDHMTVRQSRSEWINEDIFKGCIQRIVLNLKLDPKDQLYVIFNHCRVHLRDPVLELFTKNDILYSFIPSGAIGFIQPLDVCLNAQLKAKIKVYFHEWFEENALLESNISQNNYIKTPSKELLLE